MLEQLKELGAMPFGPYEGHSFAAVVVKRPDYMKRMLIEHERAFRVRHRDHYWAAREYYEVEDLRRRWETMI